ncbi:MAG: beta-phosphoglucomutase [Propionibacteriaceae bacterium]|nr:beta-phosphoglucomutase [Propionibacteriaceae bacterium]
MNEIRAVIFDLDGVITDTAEYHYLAWQRLADEEGLPFSRTTNELLRGVSRRESLAILLNGVPVDEERAAELMDRKNRYYVASLDRIGPADVLPGVLDLLHELRANGYATAIASASKNTPKVLDSLGVTSLFDAIVDGNANLPAKPAPDVFAEAARRLGVPAGLCVVVEDATAGIEGAAAAGMWTVGLGPSERVGMAHVRLDDLSRTTLDSLLADLEAAAWSVRERSFPPERQGHSETIFTIGNGAFCVRGSLEEGYPGEHPAAFMHQLWDDVPVVFTELASLPEWWGVDVWLDGERFRLDRGTITGYERSLDLRTGLLARVVDWISPAGAQVRLEFERLVDLSESGRALVRARITAGSPATVRTRAGLSVHVENGGMLHWDLLDADADDHSARLIARTRSTAHTLATACEVTATDSEGGALAGRPFDADGAPAVEHELRLLGGESLTLTKFVALVPDFAEPDAAVAAERTSARAQADAASARDQGWDAILAANTEAWRQTWDACDVTIDGDPQAQMAVRFSLFQLIIAAPRFTEHASIGAKTLSGLGYRHHVFWDTEIFMLPVFTWTQPEIARNMLMYRWHGLAGARAKASGNGFRGAQFPWESAETGDEVTPTWVPDPDDRTRLIRIWTGDIEIHITADVALAVLEYVRATGDEEFLLAHGAEMVLDGASFWASAAALEDDGRYHFRTVVGPDEYHDRIDDNAFTNHVAVWHLRTAHRLAQGLAEQHPARWGELAEQLGLDDEWLARWLEVADAIALPVDPDTGLMEQFEGYFGLTDADIALLRDPERKLSMQQIYGIEGVAQTQVLKQPDVLMLAYLLPECFTPDALRANYAYYDPRTDHELGSSLGPAVSAIMACRAGEPEYGYQHFVRAALADLLDVRHNAGDGIHGASAGGLWQAVVFGFAGLTVTEDGWHTAPMLPAHWERLRFAVTIRGRRKHIDLTRPQPA